MMKKMLYSSLIINIVLILGGLFIVQKLGGFHFMFYKMKNQGLAGQYEHRKNLFEILPKSQGKIVFLGDSLTEQCEWSELFSNPNIINRGISGDHTLGIKARLNSIHPLNPSKIFLMVGVNDLFYHPSDITIKNYKELVTEIRTVLPETELILQSLLPINNSVKDITLRNSTILDVNHAIQKLSAELGLTFIDINAQLKNDQGDLDKAYTSDGIHLNGRGYEIWKKTLLPFLADE